MQSDENWKNAAIATRNLPKITTVKEPINHNNKNYYSTFELIDRDARGENVVNCRCDGVSKKYKAH